MPGPLTRFGDLRRVTILLVFATHGITVGSLFSRIAEIQSSLGLTEAELGIAIVGVPAGVFIGSLFISRAIERWGTREALLVALPSFGVALVCAALAFSTPSLFAALLFFGLSLSSCNITMNVEADRVEAATDRRLINRCHGTWSVGFLAASVLGTGMVAAGVPPLAHFVVILAVIFAATALVVGPMEASPPRPHKGNVKPRRFAAPTVGVLFILGFACSGIWLESSSRNWSVIYLRDEFTAAAWVATLTLPAFITTQIAGRFSADALIERFGPVRVARVLAAVSLAGLLLVVAGTSIAMTLAGFALIGLGIATVHPQSLSAAARLGDRPSSVNVASLANIQTVIGFIAPPLVGFIASRYGIRAAFAFALPLPILAIFFARYLAPREAG